MQNSKFINVQEYWLQLRCSTLKVSKQQLETDGSLVIKVCYRWRITTNILPLYTWIKTLHKAWIISSHNIALFLKRDIVAIILQCQRTLILQRNALQILKSHTSVQSFSFHEGQNIQDLPFSAHCIPYLPPHSCELKPCHTASLQKTQEFWLKPAATAQVKITSCCCRTAPTASAPDPRAAECRAADVCEGFTISPAAGTRATPWDNPTSHWEGFGCCILELDSSKCCSPPS